MATCGDDLSLILTHAHGAEHEGVHRFAFDVFEALTDIAVDLGLYGAGQDLLSDAFSGNLRGMGPGYAELTFTERVSEPVLCFLADKTEPGAWNLPLFRIFADPFNTAGLVIDPKMHAGFRFEVHDLVEGKRAFFDCPEELYDLALYIGAPSRYVIKQVTSRELGEPAAATSTQRLAFMAGRYVGKDDPVMIVRCQSGLPAVGEVLEPFGFPHPVAGCMRGSHHAPLLPVAQRDAHPRGSTARPGWCASATRSTRDASWGPGTCSTTRRSTGPARRRTRCSTTCAATVRSSRTGCRSTRWSTPPCPPCRPAWPTAGRPSRRPRCPPTCRLDDR